MTETQQQTAVRYERDSDGIVTLTLDDPTASANTMTELYRDSMAAAVRRLQDDVDGVTGVIISSARGQGAWGSALYVQPVDGTIAKPLGMGIARAGVMSPDGSMIAFNRNLPSTCARSIVATRRRRSR